MERIPTARQIRTPPRFFRTDGAFRAGPEGWLGEGGDFRSRAWDAPEDKDATRAACAGRVGRESTLLALAPPAFLAGCHPVGRMGTGVAAGD